MKIWKTSINIEIVKSGRSVCYARIHRNTNLLFKCEELNKTTFKERGDSCRGVQRGSGGMLQAIGIV